MRFLRERDSLMKEFLMKPFSHNIPKLQEMLEW